MTALLESLKHQLIVSVQARPGNPLAQPQYLAVMAQAAELGGAAGLRANAPENIAAMRQVSRLPIIGLYKHDQPGWEIITPTLEAAQQLVAAGADIVALSCAFYQRPDLGALAQMINTLEREMKVPVMADVSTVEEGLWAEQVGVSLVGSTLAGYTPATRGSSHEPDLALVHQLASRLSVPIVAEGRIATPQQAAAALDAGAFAVVVGTAITNPMAITQGFVAGLEGHGR